MSQPNLAELTREERIKLYQYRASMGLDLFTGEKVVENVSKKKRGRKPIDVSERVDEFLEWLKTNNGNSVVELVKKFIKEKGMAVSHSTMLNALKRAANTDPKFDVLKRFRAFRENVG